MLVDRAIELILVDPVLAALDDPQNRVFDVILRASAQESHHFSHSLCIDQNGRNTQNLVPELLAGLSEVNGLIARRIDVDEQKCRRLDGHDPL